MNPSQQHARPAVTLLELICVLAILVIVTSIGVPMMQTMLVDARMTAAGDMIRGRLADARSKAMDEGRSWKLAFLPSSGVFQLAPDLSPEWDNVGTNSVQQQEVIRDSLPQDIIFGVSQGDVQAGGGAAGSKWETIAVYQWDGSALDDGTVYFGKAGLVPMRICVRGLTGAVSVEVPSTVRGSQP